MTKKSSDSKRVLSGMRPTGALHLGHYHGALKNWLSLQKDHECFFLAVDFHALTTHYEDPKKIENDVWQMVIDWLAVGIDPTASRIFIQSWIPEHAELHLLLSMITPLGWLERVPTYKDQQAKLADRDLSTYGFLGYPLLQAADILLYKAGCVPVGEDQVPHIEMAREIARRFNHLYGTEPDFEQLVSQAIKKMGKKAGKRYQECRRCYQEQGDHTALTLGHAVLAEQQNISEGDRERLFGYLEGSGKRILPEPEALLTKTSKFPGLDGQKMSKSYHNAIALREEPTSVEKKIRTMPTDPARVRRTDPGEPEKCPVWPLHKLYSDETVKEWVQTGCRSAGIGCLECKQPVIDAINKELAPIREAAKPYEDDLQLVKNIVSEGTELARQTARATLEEVKQAMGIQYECSTRPTRSL